MEGQKTAQDLANEALSEIGQQAFDETGGDRWRAGQPLLNDPSTTPAAPAQEEKEAEQAAPAEETTSPEPKLFLGKYKSEEEAIRGYHEAVRMGNEAKARADELQARINLVSPPAPREPDPIDDLEALGLPREPIEKVVRKLATQTIQEMLAPAAARIQADQEISERIPAYQEKFKELSRFLGENPEINQRVLAAERAGEYLMAREYAWMHFNQANSQTVEKVLQEQAQSREEEIKRTRKDAAIPTASRSDSRTKPAPEVLSSEEFERLKALAKAGHTAPLYRATIPLGKEFDQLIQGG